ncbi:MAG: FAD-binding oxidoreductase [Burkholderiales bacterium]|nr:FAD-binding oxidoreductase [Burkholderiales bacterium]
METYADRRQRLVDALAAAGTTPRLQKDTSNLFRDRADAPRRRLDVRAFDHVLEIDTAAGRVDVEGMTTYADLTDATIARGAMACVVPQLKSITIGGAVAGIGIESSSFRHGLVHETVEELEILLGDGSVVLARPDNEHADLFHGFPNSYGTLGYALRVRAKIIPVRPYVRLEHVRHADAQAFFDDLGRRCAGDADFVDGVVFGRAEHVITTGRFVDAAPYASDYTFEKIYYRSLRTREEDYLSTRDYIWRWDTDWFWCSKNLYAQNPLVRRLLGRKRLNSVFYTKVMRWNARVGLTRRLDRLLGKHPESVIQDVDIPLEHAREFLRVLPARDRHPPGVDLPVPFARAGARRARCPPSPPAPRPPGRETGVSCAPRGALAVVPHRSADALRQLRVLGRRAPGRAASARALQPAGRAQGARTRGHQVAVLRLVLHARGVLGHPRPRRLRCAQGEVRSRRSVQGPVREDGPKAVNSWQLAVGSWRFDEV